MRRPPTFTLALVLFCANTAIHAQWDLTGLHEINQPISHLNPPDRHEILHRLQIPASQLRGEPATLNGVTTFFVQAYNSDDCSPTGNCTVWVFNSQHGILLKGIAQEMTYLKQTHHGRNDVLTAMHDSAFSQQLTHWQFTGLRYVREACAMVTYRDQNFKAYPHPHFARLPCD